MTNPNHGLDAATAQRIAELSDDQFDALVADTRPHTPPPQTALQRASAAINAKSQQLCDLRRKGDVRAAELAAAHLPTKYPPPPAWPHNRPSDQRSANPTEGA